MSQDQILTIQEASDWATKYLRRNISNSNISYLIQYGQVRKVEKNGEAGTYRSDLIDYYKIQSDQEKRLKKQLGEDLNWHLSFANIKEKDRTKHVHRLHPYKGKFIPQLVEYFLDNHTDNFKNEVYFSPGDIVLDPFCGSGTSLVQANELGIHAIGIDISEFNALISNVKINKHSIHEIQEAIIKISNELKKFINSTNISNFENELLNELYQFNKNYFPSPEYRYKVRNNKIPDPTRYALEKEKEFQPIFRNLVRKYNITTNQNNGNTRFIDTWYLSSVRNEIDFVLCLVEEIENVEIQNVLKVILSRTARSCRATTHVDLATLQEPITSPYYCRKHYKICKPLFSILSWWERYSKDTLGRFYQFDSLRTQTFQHCLVGDSRKINIFKEINSFSPEFGRILETKKIKGIFSSPPYVGLIDYHEQHAYAYNLFNFQRRDEFEIGPLFKGKGKTARDSYVEGVSKVLDNCLTYLVEDCDVFLVANDRFQLYPKIAERASLKIVNEFCRPVLNRTEKDKSAYSEKIFHMKRK
ncbi:MAG: site-specific DNA-methyltransferase [Anaerolineaceae bacterium]|nr:site-specific DNA-methyltransferase [Anaerolineaceae bacterium]